MIAAEQQRPDVQAQRERFKVLRQDVACEKFVFIDESGAKTNMTHLHCRVPKGQRCVDHAPTGHWQTMTMLSAIGVDRVSVYKKSYTKPIPNDAEFFTHRGIRMVRWTGANGKSRTARVTVPDTGPNAGMHRLIMEASTYTARYRDQDGIIREKSTRCKEQVNASRVLADILKHIEQAKAGVLTKAELVQADHQKISIADHFIRYEAHLRSKGVTEQRVKTVRQRFETIATWSSWIRLSDLLGEDLERFLLREAEENNMSAGSRNSYREAVIAFANWAKRTKRIAENPFSNIPKADAKVDCRRCRRAMTEDELDRLIDAAKHRPLHDAMLIRRGKRKGQLTAKISDVERERLNRLGQERALTYKTLALTGLRCNELASITIAQADLDGDHPHLLLFAKDEKNRRGSTIAIRKDLANDLLRHLSDRLAMKRDQMRDSCKAITDSHDSTDPLIRFPNSLLRTFNRDLAFAGIPKIDSRGWTSQVHKKSCRNFPWTYR